MATIIELTNGFRVLDYNWITGHVRAFLVANPNAEFSYLMQKADCVAPNNIRFTLCRGTQSYVIPLTATVPGGANIPGGTFTNRNVTYWITDGGTIRTLKIRVSRTNPTNGADELWDGKCRVMVPMNGITDSDITEQINKSNVESVDILQ